MADEQSNGLSDIQSYPLLVEETNWQGLARSGLRGASATGPLQSMVDLTLRQVLGWRPRESDPKGFVTALKQSFSSEEKEGRQIWSWTPHSYFIQTDMGAVTGAQASIYARAQKDLEQILPILGGLKTLECCNDDEDVDAIRVVIESNLRELVDEVGYVGGPRVQRIELLFDALLGERFIDKKLSDPDEVEGHIGTLRDRLGLERINVNTIEEEQNLTNYLILADSVISLHHSWLAQSKYLGRSMAGEVFLGTQLTLLDRALAALADSVVQAYDVLDSVFVGAAERQLIKLDMGKDPHLTIGELLGWVEHLATEEGPRLLREGGKDGVNAISPTLAQMTILLKRAYEQSKSHSSNPVRGFHTPRVQRTFEELTMYAEQAFGHASWLVREDESVDRAQKQKKYKLKTDSEPSEAGTIDRVPQAKKYKKGQLVVLSAKPDEGWRFNKWKGDVKGRDKNNPYIAITMNQSKTVRAVFERIGADPDQVVSKEPDEAGKHVSIGVELTYNQAEGEVRVFRGDGSELMPEGESERAVDGTTMFTYRCRSGEEITLEAVPREDFEFMYWNNNQGDTKRDKVVVVSRGQKFKAEFDNLKGK